MYVSFFIKFVSKFLTELKIPQKKTLGKFIKYYKNVKVFYYFLVEKIGNKCYILSMERNVTLAPSVLSADFSDIRGALKDIDESGSRWVHLDVMDGIFVPNITFGPKFIADIRPHSDKFFDTHLMIENPIKYVEQFAKAGSQAITVHVEACNKVSADNAVETLKKIKALGCLAGISICPATEVSEIEALLDYVDLVLVMSVNPGFGGQSFMPSSLDKVKRLVELRKLKLDSPRKYLISIDGGINEKTMPSVVEAGIDVAVAGSAFFKAEDKKAFVQKMEMICR